MRKSQSTDLGLPDIEGRENRRVMLGCLAGSALFIETERNGRKTGLLGICFIFFLFLRGNKGKLSF